MNSINPNVVIGAVVAIILLSVGAVVATAGQSADASNRIIGTITAVAAPTVVALLALLRVEGIKKDTEDVKQQTDGRLSAIESAIGNGGTGDSLPTE